MKRTIFISLLMCYCFGVNAQVIQGKVIDANSSKCLPYASIGILNTPKGTIANEYGAFALETKDSTLKSTVRFSMIGYESQTFTVNDLVGKDNTIALRLKPVQLTEVIVIQNKESRIVGTNSYSPRGMSGWGGDKFGTGHEIGLKMDLGESYVKLEKLIFRIHKQSFDSTMFRLHIRDIVNNIPNEELLLTDILFTVSESSGLSQYNIFLKNEVVLSLEWVKVWGLNRKNMVKMNRSKEKSAVVLFSTKKNSGQMFTKWGIEADWRSSNRMTPSMYVKVL
jgi:hypothetical protein